MMNYKACIFDLDGTLLDSMDVWREVDRIFLDKRSLPFTDEYGKALSSMKLELAAEYTVKLFGLDENPKDIISEWLELAREAFAERIQPKPYGIEYIRLLKTLSIPTAVATTSQKELYLPALKRLELTEMFDAIVDSDTVNCGKDRPDIFLAAAERLNMRPEDCIVFEDTVKGLCSAASAGFITVGFLDPKQPEIHSEIKGAARFTAYDFKEFYAGLVGRVKV